MKNSIITLSLLATILFASCSPEEPQYDAHIDSPNTEPIESPADTIFKETFGTISEPTINYVYINAYSTFLSPAGRSDDFTIKYSSEVPKPEAGYPYHGTAETYVVRETQIDPVGNFDNIVLCFGGGRAYDEYDSYQARNITISNIPIPDLYSPEIITVNYRLITGGAKNMFIRRSKDGINYTDSKELPFKERKDKTYESMYNLNDYFKGYKYAKMYMKQKGPFAIDDICIIARY